MRSSLRTLIALGLLLPMVAHATSLTVTETVAGLDAVVKIVDAPAGDLSLHVLAPSGEDASVPVKSGATRTSIPGDHLQEAGAYRVYLANGSTRTSGETTFNVLPDTVDPQISRMETDTSTVAADGRSAATVSVILRDAYGNVLPGRPVELVGSRLEDAITPLSAVTDDSGVQSFSVTSTKTGTVFLRALDILSSTTLDTRVELEFQQGQGKVPTSGVSGDLSRYYGVAQPSWYPTPYPYYPAYPVPSYGGSPFAAQVAGGAVTGLQSFEVSTTPRQPRAGQSFTLTIRAVNADGKTAQDYTGTVSITAPDDPDAVLPGLTEDGQGQAKFIPKNLGMKVMPLSTSFSTPGTHTLVVEDATSVPGTTVRGEVTVTVGGEDVANQNHIQFTDPVDGAIVSDPAIVLKGKGPRLRNLTVTGGTETVNGDTDENGLFEIPVTLDASKTEHTLHVQDDSEDPKQRYSGDLKLSLAIPEPPPTPADTTPPTISASFSPENPNENEDVTLTVTSDEADLLIDLTLGDQQLSLTPDTSSPGTYTVLFRAPAPGSYPATIIATDVAANPTVKQIAFTVSAKDIPVLTDVTAEPRLGGVDLFWTPVDDDRVTSYVVYVGTEPQNFAFTLDTGKPTEGASVMGLDAGTTYYFSVTAKTKDRESTKSKTIASAPLGLSLTATPTPGSVQLTWKFPGEAIPVKGFMLEYGTSPDDLTEKREIPEKVRTMLVADLLPGIEYSFRLTPVAEAGEPLKDMSAEVAATPLVVDFLHPAPSELLPFPVQNDVPPDNTLHEGADKTPDTGLPPLGILAGGAVSAAAILLLARRRTALKAERAFLAAAQERYSRH